MDTDWCLYCQKHTQDGGLYCSSECEQRDLAHVPLLQAFDVKGFDQLNDFVEAHESSFLRPSDEPIPRLSEVRARKSIQKHGFVALDKPSEAAVAIAHLPDDEQERRALDQTRDFLKAYQRRRVWSSPAQGSAASEANGSTAKSFHTSSAFTLSQPRSAMPRPNEHPALASSIPVITELDPAMFLKTPAYVYGDTKRFERDRQFMDQLMEQAWFKQSGSSVHQES